MFLRSCVGEARKWIPPLVTRFSEVPRSELILKRHALLCQFPTLALKAYHSQYAFCQMMRLLLPLFFHVAKIGQVLSSITIILHRLPPRRIFLQKKIWMRSAKKHRIMIWFGFVIKLLTPIFCQQHGNRYHAQIADPTCRVRFTAGADRIWHIYRVAADLKSASSLRSVPQ